MTDLYKKNTYIQRALIAGFIFFGCEQATHAASKELVQLAAQVEGVQNVYNPDYEYKVALIGDSSVGKTCIYNRLENDTYDGDNYEATFYPTSIQLSYKVIIENKNIDLQVFDTGGQERYSKLTRSTYNGIHCLILCYDLTQVDTYESCKKRWKEEIDDFVTEKPFMILCGTKYDLADQRVIIPEKAKELETFFKETKLVKGVLSIEVSSKSNKNIELLMKSIAFFLLGYEPKTYGNKQLKVGDEVTFTHASGYLGKKGKVVETYEHLFRVKIAGKDNPISIRKKDFSYIEGLQQKAKAGIKNPERINLAQKVKVEKMRSISGGCC